MNYNYLKFSPTQLNPCTPLAREAERAVEQDKVRLRNEESKGDRGERAYRETEVADSVAHDGKVFAKILKILNLLILFCFNTLKKKKEKKPSKQTFSVTQIYYYNFNSNITTKQNNMIIFFNLNCLPNPV